MKMKRTLLIVLLSVCGLLLSGCKFGGRGIAGSGNRKSEKRELKPFRAIDTTGAYEIEIACQQPASFEIETDDNILPLIKTEVRDGVLYVANDEPYRASRGVQLRINLAELTQVSSRGAGEIKVDNASGDTLKFDSTGAASITAAGKVNSIIISSTGAGRVDTSKLVAEKAQVTTTGAASVDVYASVQLDVTISGAGSVNYSGHPATINKHITGFGSLNSKGQ